MQHKPELVSLWALQRSEEEAEMAGLRKGKRKGERKGESKGEPVEVFLMEPGEGRPPFTHEPGPLEFLPPDAPLPDVGDVLLFPRKVTGDTKAQAFAWGGTVAPFVVVEREHLYFRDAAEKFDPLKPRPAHHLRSVILVRRLTREEYEADPGHVAAKVLLASEP